jgi:chromosome segregation ATPase
MAQDQIKTQDLIQKGIFDEPKQSTQEFSKEVQELEKMLNALKISLSEVSKETKAVFNANKGLNNAKEVNATTKAIEKQEAIRKTTQKAIEQQRLAEIRLAQQREKAFDNYEKQLQKEKVTLEKNRKQLAKNNSEYNKLTKQLGLVRGRAKDVAAEMFNMERTGNTTGVEYVRLQKRLENLTKQTNVLDTGIKNIDKSLGLHQREVGNYAIATEQLSPHLRLIDMQLKTMGTSLTEISGEGGFKALTNSLKNFGRSAITFMLSPVGLILTTLGGLFMLIKSKRVIATILKLLYLPKIVNIL